MTMEVFSIHPSKKLFPKCNILDSTFSYKQYKKHVFDDD